MEENNVPFKSVPVIHLTVQPLRKVGEPTMSFDAFKGQVRDLLQTRCNYTIYRNGNKMH